MIEKSMLSTVSIGTILDTTEFCRTIDSQTSQYKNIDNGEWERLQNIKPFKAQFNNAISEAGFITDHIEGFEAVRNFTALYLRFMACEVWKSKEQRRSGYTLPTKPPFGMIFMGGAGGGKTTLARIISKLTGIKFYTIRELANTYSQTKNGGIEGVKGAYKEVFSSDVILDDFGIQDEKKHFGQGGLIDEIIQERYDLFQRFGKITVMTTNYTSFINQYDKETGECITIGIRELFPIQITERIEEMLKPVVFHGKSRREKAVIKFSDYDNPNFGE